MTYYMNLAYANGQTVPYGDGSRDLIRKSIGKYVDFLYDAEGEYFATEGEKGTRPDYTSVLYPARRSPCFGAAGTRMTCVLS